MVDKLKVAGQILGFPTITGHPLVKSWVFGHHDVTMQDSPKQFGFLSERPFLE